MKVGTFCYLSAVASTDKTKFLDCGRYFFAQQHDFLDDQGVSFSANKIISAPHKFNLQCKLKTMGNYHTYCVYHTMASVPRNHDQFK